MGRWPEGSEELDAFPASKPVAISFDRTQERLAGNGREERRVRHARAWTQRVLDRRRSKGSRYPQDGTTRPERKVHRRRRVAAQAARINRGDKKPRSAQSHHVE